MLKGGTQNKDAESYCSHSNWKLAGAFCSFPLGIPSPTIFSAVTEGALKGNSVVFLLFPHYLLCCRYWCVNMLSSLSSQPALFLERQEVSVRWIKSFFPRQSERNTNKTTPQQGMERNAKGPCLLQVRNTILPTIPSFKAHSEILVTALNWSYYLCGLRCVKKNYSQQLLQGEDKHQTQICAMARVRLFRWFSNCLEKFAGVEDCTFW